MEGFIRKIQEVIYNCKGHYDLFHDTLKELYAKGIGKGCYQDYSMLADVLSLLDICESEVKRISEENEETND